MAQWGDERDAVSLSADAVLAGVSAIKSANGIVTDAQWSAFIDGRTDAQLLALVRGFFKTLVDIK